eukprot:132735-Chlamydomonas_euryale.AAC.2
MERSPCMQTAHGAHSLHAECAWSTQPASRMSMECTACMQVQAVCRQLACGRVWCIQACPCSVQHAASTQPALEGKKWNLRSAGAPRQGHHEGGDSPQDLAGSGCVLRGKPCEAYAV